VLVPARWKDVAMESVSAPRFVFVVTYGRSGSTLTQGMLNTLPRTLVRGENGFYILPLFRSYAMLDDFNERFGKAHADKVTSAFYGLRETDLDDFAATAGELVQRQLLGTVPVADVDRLGFKEVLWHRVPQREWAPFFDFMDRAFGDPLYVLNQRDVAMASTSGFWRKKPDAALRQIGRIRRMQQFLRESRPARTFDNAYEAMTSEDHDVAAAQLRGLAEFVTGGCDDELLAALFATRETGYGPNPFGKARES
jgi:hypothetical protein